jgi:hypothetical protein
VLLLTEIPMGLLSFSSRLDNVGLSGDLVSWPEPRLTSESAVVVSQ